MKNAVQYYSVGPLLYCPANNANVANSIISQKFGINFSMAFCLEDTIDDAFVPDAEHKLAETVGQIFQQSQEKSFYLPQIFIRVRNPEQISRLLKLFQNSRNIVTGFILPKFSVENADAYIQAAIKINEAYAQTFYIMPIYESRCIVNLMERYHVLYELKEKLAQIEELVLNIRVGGNDLCHLFGFRRHATESIHNIKPVANILADIVTVYGMDYVVSGPVWEYYNGSNWRQGLCKEISDDIQCGLIGKTVIHPKQIEVVNESFRVSRDDFADAKAILAWDAPAAGTLVAGSAAKERMNEYKTHTNWALRTLLMAEAFGLKELA